MPQAEFSVNRCDDVVAGHSVGGSCKKKMTFQIVIVFEEKYVSYN